MAKKRRRQKLQSRPVRDPNDAPPMRAPAPAADEQFAPSAPPTGMSAASMPFPEEQGYARGGSVRRYADGGDVDPMGYVPDQPMRGAQPPQPQFDPYSMVGRQEPTISPFAAARPETGYAEGGEVEEQLRSDWQHPPSFRNRVLDAVSKVVQRPPAPRGSLPDQLGYNDIPTYARGGPIPAAQVPAYTDPVYPAPSAANADLYAKMAAARERTINPPPLPSRAPPPWQDSSDLQGVTGISSKQSVGPYRYARGGLVEDDYAAPAPPDGLLAQQQLDEERRRQAAAQQQRPESWATPRGDEYKLYSGPGSPYDPTGSNAQARGQERPQPAGGRMHPGDDVSTDVTSAGGRTGYAEPAPAAAAQPSTFSQVLDYLHNKFGVGSAQAADTPVQPQASPMTGYSGGYGGDLTTTPTPPPANALEASQRNPPPVGAPLSLQSDAPPSISGQRDTASVPQAPGSSRLAQVQRDIAERPASGSPDDGLLTKLASVPGALLERYGDASRLKDAERELYTGSRWGISDTDRPIMPQIHAGIDKLLRGDRSHTPAEAQQVLKTIQDDPQSPHHNPMVQGTFDTLLKTKGPEEAAAFTQSLRDPYNKLGSIAQAAIANGNWQMAAKFIEQQHNLLPNNQKLNITLGGEGGGFLATVRPEGPGGGAAYSVRLPNADALHKLATEGMQFDSVGKNGLEKTLRDLVAPKPAGDQPLRPIAIGEPGYDKSQAAAQRTLLDAQRTQQADGRGGEQLAPRPVGSAAPGTGIAAAPIGTSQLENVPRSGPGGTIQTGTPPVTRIARGEGIQYDANGTPFRMQGSGRIEVAQPSQLDTPAPLSVRDIQRTVRPGGEPTDPVAAKSAADRDARTAASRAEFSQKVHGRPDPNAPVATPEQAARAGAAPGNYRQVRDQLLGNWNRLVEEAKPRNVAAAVNDPRRDPRTESRYAESEGSTDTTSTTNPTRPNEKGGGGGGGSSSSSRQRSSSRDPKTMVIPGAESHYMPDAHAQAVERERQQKAQAALTAYGPAPYERPGWHTDDTRPLPSSVHATGPLQTGKGAAPSDIPNKSVQDLINNPKLAAEFDSKYGVGASRRILGANQVRY